MRKYIIVLCILYLMLFLSITLFAFGISPYFDGKGIQEIFPISLNMGAIVFALLSVATFMGREPYYIFLFTLKKMKLYLKSLSTASTVIEIGIFVSFIQRKYNNVAITGNRYEDSIKEIIRFITMVYKYILLNETPDKRHNLNYAKEHLNRTSEEILASLNNVEPHNFIISLLKIHNIIEEHEIALFKSDNTYIDMDELTNRIKNNNDNQYYDRYFK